MAYHVSDYKGVCNAAMKMFKEILETPHIRSVEFNFSAEVETPAEVKYTINRVVIPTSEEGKK